MILNQILKKNIVPISYTEQEVLGILFINENNYLSIYKYYCKRQKSFIAIESVWFFRQPLYIQQNMML